MSAVAPTALPNFRITDLCSEVEQYLEPEQVRAIYRAFMFGAEAHDGQTRASGEPYIFHPLQVARILADMRLDYQVLIAAILHDVIEDTPTNKEQLTKRFGADVAELVDGVSKLTQVEFGSKAEAQAEYFRKMMLAMARDIRVMLIKLADRLHNMRTLGALRPEKRRKIARETLDIYAPIANRLGLNNFRLELEDLGFKALYPQRHRVLADEIKRARGHRRQVISTITRAIKSRVKQEGFRAEVIGREKHLYSLYDKMVRKGLSFAEVMDIYAFRIIVEDADLCYRVVGCMHNLYKPIPGRFKDYIAIPKANGYQSLHTVLMGPFGVPIEIQIRTHEMHAIAESGVAAHWRYKTGEADPNAASARASEWVRGLLEMQQATGDTVEFIESVKVDLFTREVYVFTPAGEIMQMPVDATAVDFAYAVHTDVGNTCVAVKIDRRYAPLSTQLQSGQTVEVVTAPWARPNASWLNFVVTGKARANIRNQLKDLRAGEAEELGERLLNQALAVMSLQLRDFDEAALTQLHSALGAASMAEVLVDIGLGRKLAPLVAHRLATAGEEPQTAQSEEPEAQAVAKTTQRSPLYIRGTEGMLVTFGKCCHPIPGDPVAGFVSAGRGIIVHHRACHNVAEYASEAEKWLDVEWEPSIDSEFTVEIRLLLHNQRGALANVAASIAQGDANIGHIKTIEREGMLSTLDMLIEVRNRKHLADVMRRLRTSPEVTRIHRTRA
jgi:GTP diphosphokinase / guanosine-3',5'-bis(diphosphate) 3'-diphosphatase